MDLWQKGIFYKICEQTVRNIGQNFKNIFFFLNELPLKNQEIQFCEKSETTKNVGICEMWNVWICEQAIDMSDTKNRKWGINHFLKRRDFDIVNCIWDMLKLWT